MHQLPLMHIEVFQLILETQAVPPLGSEDQLRTLHVVVYHIFECRLQGVLVHQVKVDFVVRGDRDLGVALDVVDEATHVQLVVLAPSLFLDEFVEFLPEEQNVV